MSEQHSAAAPARQIGVIAHPGRADAMAAAAEAVALLRAEGVATVGCDTDQWPADALPEGLAVRDAAGFAQGLDAVFVFGGDGTFLRAAYLARGNQVPLLGVNLGRLGFLAEVERDQVPAAVARVAAGQYEIEHRMTLRAEVQGADGSVVASGWALNEVSIERAVPQRLIVLEVRVGETLFAQVPADALICATPTGSTAYAFSARGPILSPAVEAILLVPVAPHALFDRTLVVDPAESVWVMPVDDHNGCVVSMDGRETITVPPGGRVRVSRADAPVRLLRLGDFDFYQRVREKFGLS